MSKKDISDQNFHINVESVLAVLERRSKVIAYEGYKLDDQNLKNHVLLIVSQETIYSFQKPDIVDEEELQNGQVQLWVRVGSEAWRSAHFRVGETGTRQSIIERRIWKIMRLHGPSLYLDPQCQPRHEQKRMS